MLAFVGTLVIACAPPPKNGLGNPSHPTNYRFAGSLWDTLGNDFNLPSETTDRTEVRQQINWFMAHPTYLKEMATKAQPYLFYVFRQIKQRNLPSELALLPMIESSYDPFAYSSAGACGLWQMMPGTASGFGLKVSWWYDGRRDIIASTNSALNYLSYLGSRYKGNWLLAIAAYNTGEGMIDEAIRHNVKAGKPTEFWDLPLPAQTKTYVPKLLALATILKHPYDYPISWPDVPDAPYLAVVNIGSQIDLSRAAKMANIPLKKLSQLNPGFNRWATDPEGPYTLVLPVQNAASFQEKLDQLPQSERVTWMRHTVCQSESLGGIANHYKTSIHLIKKVNSLKDSTIRVGQALLIPMETSNLTRIVLKSEQHYLKSAHKIPSVHITSYVIQPGDTLDKVAKKYHVKVSELKFWNGIRSKKSTLAVGTKLIVWPHKKEHIKRLIRHLATGPQKIIYRVRSGDTLSTIAQKEETTTENLKRWNRLDNANQLKAHQVLVVYR